MSLSRKFGLNFCHSLPRKPTVHRVLNQQKQISIFRSPIAAAEKLPRKTMSTNLKSPFSFATSLFSGLSLYGTPTSHGLSNENLSWDRNKDAFTATNEFTVASFNLLAPCYKRLPASMRESSDNQLWTKRASETIDFCHTEIYGDSDIIGFQEYWLDSQYTELFKEGFDSHGYEVRHLKRTGKKTDSVAIAVKKDVFEILGSENIYLCSIGDRVALVLHLHHKATGKTVLVANTHLSFPHSSFDRVNQMQQMKKLTNAMSQYATKYGIKSATRIVLGDFNVNSSSQVCDHLRKAGYFSCFEVKTPSNLFGIINTGDGGDDDGDDIYANSPTKGASSHETSISALSHQSSLSSVDTSSKTRRSPRSQSIDTVITSREMKNDSSEKPDGRLLRATSYVTSSTSSTSSSSMKSKSESSRASSTPGFDLDFVSHRTHDSNDVGVDHIFIKPELEIEIEGNSVSPYEAPAPPNVTPLRPRTAPPKPPPLSSLSKATFVTSNELLSPWSMVLSCLFVADSTVLPRTLVCDQWHPHFTISDHRPVSSTILFAMREETPSQVAFGEEAAGGGGNDTGERDDKGNDKDKGEGNDKGKGKGKGEGNIYI